LWNQHDVNARKADYGVTYLLYQELPELTAVAFAEEEEHHYPEANHVIRERIRPEYAA